MIRFVTALRWLVLIGWMPAIIGIAGAKAQERVHKVYFEGTDYELNVYRISGKMAGSTLMLIGGIQGDEPGGFLSADLYADLSLAKGNLIVVPRANFQSILLNQRKVNADMNRKFADTRADGYETEVVAILKQLISESDCLLNLHDGSGFYADVWVDADRNPRRFGQSVIADTDTYVHAKTGRRLELGAMARAVCEQINRQIPQADLHFHFNNHRTQERTTPHKEQRKSATFYALTTWGVPAFGIETSKTLPLDLKVRHHNLAINAFMAMFEVIPETPRVNLAPPVLDYLVVTINDSLPVVVGDGQTLHLAPGDTLTVSHIEANYERGLTADVVDHGGINDLRKPLVIDAPTRIVVRKDYDPFGTVFLVPSQDRSTEQRTVATVEAPLHPFLIFRIQHNDRNILVENHGHLAMVRGDRFKILDVITNLGHSDDLVVNVKGFVGSRGRNTGEDRGYEINTARDLWERYSLNGNGAQYQAVVHLGQAQVGRLLLDIAEPELRHLVLTHSDGTLRCYRPGQTVALQPADRPTVMALATNVGDNQGITLILESHRGTPLPLALGELMPISHLPTPPMAGADPAGPNSGAARLAVMRDGVAMGHIQLTSAHP